MSSVVVIDYGMGNLHSIAKALQHASANVHVQIESDPAVIMRADRVVFPGVGAIRDCMNALQRSGLDEVIRQVVTDKPVLGICLGMQALLTDSEENEHCGCLNIIPGHVVRFPKAIRNGRNEILKVPHMGWNEVQQRSAHPLWQNIAPHSRFYFVHSYYVQPDETGVVAATATYPDSFCCAIEQENIFAVQFHPEKSQRPGLTLLHNFLHWDGSS